MRVESPAPAALPQRPLSLPCRAYLLRACELGAKACRDANEEIEKWWRATGADSAWSDEQCQQAWERIPPDFVMGTL